MNWFMLYRSFPSTIYFFFNSVLSAKKGQQKVIYERIWEYFVGLSSY